MEQYSPPAAKLGLRSNKRYHVFLSFRGEDVRKTFVDHLFVALSAAGLNVFLDSEKLEKGEMIWETLERAIESSAIRIPIFSRGYADSTWCLKEAAAMLSTPALIIPLFYHVDPTHVRYPEGNNSPYKQSFLKHYSHPDRHPKEEVDEWKDALLKICGRSGWSMDITQGHEAHLVKKVVNDLIKTLDRVPLQVAKHPVGLDNLKNALIDKLNLNLVDKVIKVGIWGIGGIGKTTVAKAVYNQLHADFEAASFISDVCATAAETKGLRNLQKKILKDLIKYGGKVDSVDEGKSLFIDRLRGKRVLLILDDVDNVGQLDALVGDWLHSGSRVIITSRDQHILNLAQISSECMREISGLDINEGLQLFSWHAFLRATPNQRHEDLSKRIVEACKGHPLSLEVIGSFLYDKHDNTGCWHEALSNIIQYPEIQRRLYISYNALNEEEKEIFLDIACFFIGEEKTRPVIFWKALYKMVDTALCNLSMKLLIKIDGDGVFHMHDLLRDMGRSIAEKEKEHNRLWKGTNFSRLRLYGGSPQKLEMLFKPGLRYLHLKNLRIEGMTADTLAMLPSSLIWLRMERCQLDIGNNREIEKPLHSRFGGTFLELRTLELIECKGLDILYMSSLFSIPNIQLQYLNFTMYSLSELERVRVRVLVPELERVRVLVPERERKWKRLWKLLRNLVWVWELLWELEWVWERKREQVQETLWENLWELKRVWEQVRALELALQRERVRVLERVRVRVRVRFLERERVRVRVRELEQMKTELEREQEGERKSRLINVPDSIGSLTQLKHLILRGCFNLTNLPDTIGNLSQLQNLDLTGCANLKNLPYTIGNLSQLQHLYVKGCYNLNNLDIIGNLSQLQCLYLEGSRLNNLPDIFGNMSQLQHLYVKGYHRLNDLPDTIGNLAHMGHGIYMEKT